MFVASSPGNVGAYAASGHLQFDIRLVQAIGGNAIGIYYGFNGGGTATCALYTLSTASLSMSAFTHVSIPISTFSANCTSQVDDPVYLSFFTPSPGPALIMDDIKWTGN